MKTRRILLAAGLVAVALTLTLASVASATGAPLPAVSGGVGFSAGEAKSFAVFNVKATGRPQTREGTSRPAGSSTIVITLGSP